MGTGNPYVDGEIAAYKEAIKIVEEVGDLGDGDYIIDALREKLKELEDTFLLQEMWVRRCQ